MEHNRRTALYCRTAKEDTFALETQMLSLYQYGEENGYDLRAAYCDNGESGLTLDGLCMQKLLADIKSGEVERVVVRDISRLTRNRLELSNLLSLFARYDVELISVDDCSTVNMSDLQMFPRSYLEFINLLDVLKLGIYSD